MKAFPALDCRAMQSASLPLGRPIGHPAEALADPILFILALTRFTRAAWRGIRLRIVVGLDLNATTIFSIDTHLDLTPLLTVDAAICRGAAALLIVAHVLARQLHPNRVARCSRRFTSTATTPGLAAATASAKLL